MKVLLFVFLVSIVSVFHLQAQTSREVDGKVIDTTKLGIPGASITLKTEKGDSTIAVADGSGNFVFPAVTGSKITVTVSSIGYQAVRKHFVLDNGTKTAVLDPVILKSEANVLSGVTIVGINPVILKEDTVEYKASAYKVRENAPVEDLIKKLPGVDVDVNGNVTTQGKQVTKVRINGKDFMGGDVQSATKNLPADVVENIQMIDDYGDQANLTGVKTGEPDKIMNITIRKDKNYGYFGQATGGGGRDALPASEGIPDDTRYLATLNSFRFNGDQQMALLGSVNNTNVNTFSFNPTSTAGGGGNNFGGGGGRGNAARGAQNSGSLITTQNGITDAHSIGANLRDQWGKKLSVYGSYSFADNTVSTTSSNFQRNNNATNPSTNNQLSDEVNRNINHRFTWNMEYKPDTINYLKITPTYSYAGTDTRDNEKDSVVFPHNTPKNAFYSVNSVGNSTAPGMGIIALYNHRFPRRHNLSINVNINTAKSDQYQNVAYVYAPGTPPVAPINQIINTNSLTTTFASTVSYLQPVGRRDYLEFSYMLSHAHTTNDKLTDTLVDNSTLFNRADSLSTEYNYNFTTNRFGINYRFIEKKYNYTLGLAAQPSVLDGYSPLTGLTTHESIFNFIPTARYIYNFSRSQAFSLNYNGSSSSPTFTQLQPTTDHSNALYPVQGNPFLKPQFTDNFSIRYNQFSFATGNILFTNVSFQKIDNQIVTNTITYSNKSDILTQYLNADGYYNISGNVTYAKPWENRKYTLMLTGTVNYSNGISYLTNVTPTDSIASKNISKNLQFTPGARFRVDITDVVDAQVLTNYAINQTHNSVSSPMNNNPFTRTWNIGVNGKNYFLKDWTFSYDYSKAINYGYSSSLGKVTNPNVLNMYLERRFLKDHRATIRLSAFDLFNQNTGYTSTSTPSSFTQTVVNRLSRYYLATFTLRLQKFAGKAPSNPDRGFRRGGDGAPGGPPPGP